MPWINLATERWRIRNVAKKLIDHMINKPNYPRFGRTPALNALILGDQELFNQAVELSRNEFIDLKKDRQKYFALPEVLPNLLGLSVIFHITGEDQTELWKKIGCANAYNDKHMQALCDLAAELYGSRDRTKKTKPTKPGLFHRFPEFLKVVDSAPLSDLFDRAMCPDSDLWPFELDSFALPLGLLYFFEQRKSNKNNFDIFKYFKIGAHPARHMDVIYERQWKKPGIDVIPDKKRQDSWCGMDVVEFSNSELICYHYVTLKWEAPLIFQKDLNAFYFLDQLEESWSFVKNSINTFQWNRIELNLKNGNCKHVIVHDTKRAPIWNGHLERAADHYGINLIAKDITEV